MKWTALPLIAAALIVYGLLFAVHAARDNQKDTSEALESSPVQARTSLPAPTVERALPAQVEESEERVEALAEPQPVEPEPVAPIWEGEAWAAGCRAYEGGDYSLARAALEEAVREEETRANRHYLLGLTYLELDEAELAVGELERSVSLDPTLVRPYVNLGRAYLRLDDAATAREVIDASLEIDLAYADAWQVLGRIELQEGNLEGAEAAFLKAAELDGEHAWAFNNLGYVRILEERFDEAVQPLSQAVALRDEVACFHNNLGVALERSGDLTGAAAAYLSASELGHATALASAERVEAVVLARGQRETEEEGTRLAAAPADTVSVGAW